MTDELCDKCGIGFFLPSGRCDKCNCMAELAPFRAQLTPEEKATHDKWERETETKERERILRMAEAEDACESVLVGGLAIDMGFPVVTPPDFKCTVCGVECPISDPVEGAICEEHCGDHNYEYDRGERKWSCVHCDKERPYDW